MAKRSKSIGTNSINELWHCVGFDFATETFSDFDSLSPNNLQILEMSKQIELFNFMFA